jgi:hypothetical protein
LPWEVIFCVYPNLKIILENTLIRLKLEGCPIAENRGGSNPSSPTKGIRKGSFFYFSSIIQSVFLDPEEKSKFVFAITLVLLLQYINTED